MRIGLQNPRNTSLHGGPAVFTERLTSELSSRGLYSESEYQTWMNLAFRPVPEEVRARKPRIIIRFDGTWNMAAWPFWGRRPGRRAPLNTWVYRYLNRTLRRNVDIADGFIFQSAFSRDMVQRLCGALPEKPTHTIFNGVDLEQFTPAPVENGESGRGGAIRILVSHKHWAVKRSWMIPRIIAQMKSLAGREIRVRVLGGDTSNPLPGSPTPLGMMKKNARRYGVLGEFDFIGHVPPEKLPEYYRWAHLMLNLSFADPCPNVVVEALASGLPVIGPSSGGLAELVDRSQWLVDSGEDPFLLYNPYIFFTFPDVDIDAYVRVILDVVENIEAESRYARQRAENAMDMNNIVERYISALTEEGV
jgi:glycosyltransferase involved in cell wall biosynthesis